MSIVKTKLKNDDLTLLVFNFMKPVTGVEVLPGPFRGMRRAGEFRGDLTIGHASRSGPEIKNGRSRAKDGALERLRCGTV